MASLNPNFENKLNELLKRLKANARSVVVLNIAESVKKDEIKGILDYFMSYLKDGTLCVVGDCEFNTVHSNLKSLSSLSEKQRKYIYTPVELRLMGLYEGARFSNHPSVEIACAGKYAQFLVRHQSLDFPYGKRSIFADFYDLDAIYLSIGETDKPYPLKYDKDLDDKVVFRNQCLYDDKLYAYLDTEFDYEDASEKFESLSLFEEANIKIYGERYRYFIDHI